jgi:hypothetical protein
MAIIKQASKIHEEATKLELEADALLEPLTMAAIKKGKEACLELVAALPSGFQRSELRTWIVKNNWHPGAVVVG